MEENKIYVVASVVIFIVLFVALILTALGFIGIDNIIISILSFGGFIIAILNARKRLT